MKYINNRNRFKSDLEVELLIEKLELSDNFMSVIRNIDNPVSKILKQFARIDFEITPYKQNNLDVSDKKGYVSFNNGKGEVKIGRFINKLIDHLRKDHSDRNDEDLFGGKITEKDIQDFVTKFTDITIKSDNTSNIVILNGEKIYDVYQKDCTTGTLASSCMIGDPSYFFDIYTENTSVVSIATLWEGDPIESNLKGRALLWNTDKGKYMDRIYADYNETELMFKSWAKSNGYFYRRHQSYNETTEFLFDGKPHSRVGEISVQLDIIYDNFPYMDTFKYLDYENKILYNYHDDNATMKLEETNGGYEVLNNGKWILSKISEADEHFQDVERIYDEDHEFFEDLVLTAKDWSSFKDLFSQNEHSEFITDMLEGDGYKYFDGDYHSSDISEFWSYIKEDTYNKIIDMVIKELDYNPGDIFRITKSDELSKVTNKYKDIHLGKYDRYMDRWFNNIKYFCIDTDEDSRTYKELITLPDFINNYDLLSDIKDAMIHGAGEAQRDADESEAYDTIRKSITDYLGKSLVKDSIYISLDTDDLKDKFKGLDSDNLSELEQYYIENGSLLELISDSIRYMDMESPRFEEPRYGFQGDSSEYIDEAVSERLDWI